MTPLAYFLSGGAAHRYEELLDLCRRGLYPSARVRAASGRLNLLLGVSPAQLAALRREAQARRVGLVLIGSRVSGPRARQRTLHPALEACLPLKTDRRAPSALFRGAQGVEIDKTAIKDYGPEDPRTSDLSIVLVDPRRSPAEAAALAEELEALFAAEGWGFPVRFFARLNDTLHRSEAEFQATGVRYLRGLMPPDAAFTDEQLRAALGELYTTVNMPRRLLGWGDVRNGAVTMALFAASFSLGLGFRWPLLPIGFFFGLIGRYLARFRAAVATSFGDGLVSNASALAIDGLQGALIMGCLINPATGLGLPLRAVLTGSFSHTLAKGSLRLFLDKVYASGDERRQSRGVLLTAALNFLQGVVTSFVYAGSRAALALQAGLCLLGAALLFGPAVRRKFFVR